MKQLLFRVVIMMLLGSSCLVFADDGRKEDHDKLRALKTKVEDAFNRRDARALAACCAKKFAITTIDQTTLTSAEEIDVYLKKVFSSPDSLIADLKIAPEADILTSFVDADNGYCFGKNHETYTLKNGRKAALDSRWTATLHRENGEWQVVAIHAGVNLLDNPLVTMAEAKGTGKLAGGFVAGAVVAGIGMLLCRRKSGTSCR